MGAASNAPNPVAARRIAVPTTQQRLRVSAPGDLLGGIAGNGAPATTPACTLSTTPVDWDQRTAEHFAAGSGATFALGRSSSDGRTEGVMAPRSLAALGITDMLTFADCFDSEADVRGALGAAPQNELDLAAQAWTHCRTRAAAITRMLSSSSHQDRDQGLR